jgi:hypothetical protein
MGGQTCTRGNHTEWPRLSVITLNGCCARLDHTTLSPSAQHQYESKHNTLYDSVIQLHHIGQKRTYRLCYSESAYRVTRASSPSFQVLGRLPYQVRYTSPVVIDTLRWVQRVAYAVS